MIRLGEHQTLTIKRMTSVGAYLSFKEEDDDVLLPKKYLNPNSQIGNEIDVFIYKDHEQRLIATTLKPKITLNSFALLTVKSVSPIGVFLDWGLEKDLFLPFAEQKRKLNVGDKQMVYLYIDEKTNRLAASAKLNKFLSKIPPAYPIGEEVAIIVFEATPLGYNVIVNNKYKGLVYHNECHTPLRYGQPLKGYIKQIREEGGIDISISALGVKRLADGTQTLLSKLTKSGGFLNLNDDSSPDEIAQKLNMSKKTFKRSLGILYKQGQIEMIENGIKLKNNNA